MVTKQHYEHLKQILEFNKERPFLSKTLVAYVKKRIKQYEATSP